MHLRTKLPLAWRRDAAARRSATVIVAVRPEPLAGAVLIRDDADRDAIAMQLTRYRDEDRQRWADVIDLLTMYPDADAESRVSSENWRPAR